MNGMTSKSSKSTRSRISAGLLMFLRKADKIEFLLVHPGGPFWKNKEEGVWTIPKGEVESDEDLLARARTEFEEEIGINPTGNFAPLGTVKQKGGKTVHAWAFEGDLPEPFKLHSNTFQIEWPPLSGRFREFPEIDRVEFFPEEIARRKINPAQLAFLERLLAALESR